MRISAQEEYGLRCMVQLAKSSGEHPVAMPDIAAAEGLSKQYVAKLMHQLQKAGLIDSTRGAHGGYSLSRPASDINAAQIMEAFGTLISSEHHAQEICATFSGNRERCVHMDCCGLQSMWGVIMKHIGNVLQRITLEELAQAEGATTDIVGQHVQAAAADINNLSQPVIPANAGIQEINQQL